MVKKIGSMIKQMRVEAGISQEKLGQGLISPTGLSRIERGEVEQDSFMLSALIQRLGKSMDRFEMAVSNEEYKMILLRAFLQESILQKDFEESELQLRDYEGFSDSKKELHRQYLIMIHGAIEYLKGGTAAEYAIELERALVITCPKWEQKNWNEICLCEQEMQIVILLSYVKLETGEWKESVSLLTQLEEYIDYRVSSEEVRVRIYPKCCYLLAKIYLIIGEREKAWWTGGRALECLTENGIISFVLELLELRAECQENELERKQIEAIKFLYGYIEYEVPEEIFLKLLLSGEQKEVILSNELLREERAAKGLSQDELAYGICARETLSMIERGRKAYKKNMRELLNRLGVERESYYGSVIASDYETYEKIRLYKKNMFLGNRDERMKLLKEIEERIDTSIPVNRQFLEANYLIYGNLDKEIGYEKVIERLVECLRYTMPDFDDKVYRVPSREEFVILNNIALRLIRNDRKLEALALYRKIFDSYKRSKVALEHHAYQMMTLYLDYTALLEECNYIKCARREAKEGLILINKNCRGDLAGMVFANQTCVYMKMSTEEGENLCEMCSRHGYYLLLLFKCNNDSRIIKRFYEERYSIKLLE